MKIKTDSAMALKSSSPNQLSTQNLHLPSALWQPRWLKPSAWVEHLPFAFWIMEASRPQRFVELGTHFGTSYFAFCQAAERLELGCQAWAVDTWKGDEHAGFYGEEIYEQVRAHNSANYAAFSNLIRSTFDEALPYFTDGSIDLLHIDGHHSFDSVRHDFESWLPKLSARAVVLFHDTNVKERHFGVGRFFDTLKLQYPCFDFPHGHGLGVIGVGKTQTPLLQRLFEIGADSSESKSLRNIFSRLGHACAVASGSESLKEDNSNLNAQCAEHRRELDSTRSALSEAQRLAASRLDQVADLSRRLHSAVEHSAALRGEWAERITFLTESRDEMSKAHARELALLESLAQELRKTLEEATTRERSLVDSHGHFQEKWEKLAGENAQLREESVHQREKMMRLESEVARFSSIISEQETTLVSHAELLALKSQALADILLEKELLTGECMETKLRVSELHAELLSRDEKIAAQERSLLSTSASLASERAEKLALSDQLSQATNRSQEQLAALKVEWDSKIAAQDAALQSQSNALEAAQAQHGALSEELEHARRHSAEQITVLERERDALQANVDERFRELAHLAQIFMHKDMAIEDSRAAAARMKTSASWKVTKPLRWFGNTFGPGAKEKKRLQRQCSLLTESGLFDAAWYSTTYPDVVQSGLDPVEHYLRHGAREGRNPSTRFNTQNYLRRYPDVAKATPPLNPLLHYVLHGKKEGRFA
jgi:Methyltransferase domain